MFDFKGTLNYVIANKEWIFGGVIASRAAEEKSSSALEGGAGGHCAAGRQWDAGPHLGFGARHASGVRCADEAFGQAFVQRIGQLIFGRASVV